MKYLDEGDYFICSDGLVPTKLYAGQTKAKSKGGYMLTNKSTSTQSLGDFSCRWTAVLAIAAATLVVLTGGAALVAVAVIAVGVAASGLLCGGILAGQRKWLTFNETVFITGANAINADDIMVCPLIGGTIHFAPGIDSPLKAAAVAARNATWATFEGMAIGFMAFSGGSAFLAEGATPFAAFGTNLLKNYAATLTTPLGWAGRGLATLDQVYVEGMLINGETQEEAWKEHGWRGATIVEQPFINIGEKVVDKKPVTWQDYYYAGLTVGTLGLIPAHDAEAANMRFKQSLERMAGKMKKGLVWEGVKESYRVATTEETKAIVELKEKLLKENPDLNETSNVATAKGRIDGNPIDLVANSSKFNAEGTVKAKPFKEQKLKTAPTESDKIRNRTHEAVRAYDSEAKICEHILDNTSPTSKGEITIISERDFCTSCENIIDQQMKALRPGIKINKIYTKPYLNK